MRLELRSLLLFALLGAGCDPADEVRVQALPPLERPSAEARAGLPEVAGVWRFAGWELAADDTVNLTAELPQLGEIRLQTQRLDSLAGEYVGAVGRFSLVGEARRDSVVTLAAAVAAEATAFLAGRFSRDTLWVTLTSLVERQEWPERARVAFVRQQVATPFVRLHGQPVYAVADTAAGPPLAGLPPGDTAPPAQATPAPGQPPAREPRPERPRQAERAERAEQQEEQEEQEQTEQEERRTEPPRPTAPPTEVRDPPRPTPPRVLGTPVRRDTTPPARDTTAARDTTRTPRRP